MTIQTFTENKSTIYLASASIREETSFEFPGLRHPPIPLSRAGSNQGTLEKLATGIAKHGRVAHTNDFGHVSGRRFSRFGWASMGCTLTKKSGKARVEGGFRKILQVKV